MITNSRLQDFNLIRIIKPHRLYEKKWWETPSWCTKLSRDFFSTRQSFIVTLMMKLSVGKRNLHPLTSEPNDITWRSGWSPCWKITHNIMIMMSLQFSGLCCLGPQYGSKSFHYKLKYIDIWNSMQFHIDSTGCCCSDTTLFVHPRFFQALETCVKCTLDLQAKVPKLNISPTMLPIENKQGWYKFRYDHVATYKFYQSNCWDILSSSQAVHECVCVCVLQRFSF